MPLCAVRHTRQRAIDAIHVYLQPFFVGPASLFSGFVPFMQWFVGTFLFGSPLFPDGFLLWCPCWQHSKDIAQILWCPCWQHSKDMAQIPPSSFQHCCLIGSAFALLRTSSLVINSFHLMFRSLHKHLVWKLATFCLFSSACFRTIEKPGHNISVDNSYFGVCIYTL